MNQFQSFFEKFRKILDTPGAQKKPIIELIQQSTGFTLTESEINIKEGIVYLNVSPLLKNEIYMRKKKLLEIFSSRGTSIRDIR